MRARHGAALLALFLAGAARGETVVRELGPLMLEGVAGAMDGPESREEMRFERSGYITAHSVDIVDAAGRSRSSEGLHCHSVFYRAGAGDSVPVRPGDPSFRSEPVRLGTSDNQAEIRFPKGFGVFVDSATAYGVSGMLTDPDGSRSGEYRVRYRFELAPAEPPLKPLRGLLVKMQQAKMEDGKECGHSITWYVPAGRHVYEKSFVMPVTARVHYMSSHVHSHARDIELVEEKGGRVLHRAPIRLGERGQPLDSPLYSSADGLLLKKGARYVFRLSYENPGTTPIDAMGNLRLFVSEGS